MGAVVSDRAEMVRRMDPAIVPGRWVFRSVSEAELPGLLPVTKAVFREAEGISVLVPAEDGEPAMAQITLRVFSDLDGVGLTAAVTGTLATAGIACNVIAARHHDHLFVAEGRCEEALARLRERAEEGLA